MPDTPFSVQLSYMAHTEPLTEETLAYLVRTEAEHVTHIDALTAAVRDMPGLSLHQAEGDTSNDFPLVERAAVLGEPSETREDDGHIVTYTRFVERGSSYETFLPIDGKPHHIALVHDPQKGVQWYVDGEVPTAQDEVAYYDHVLPPERITAHYVATSSPGEKRLYVDGERVVTELDLDDPVVREAQVYGGDDRARHVAADEA